MARTKSESPAPAGGGRCQPLSPNPQPKTPTPRYGKRGSRSSASAPRPAGWRRSRSCSKPAGRHRHGVRPGAAPGPDPRQHAGRDPGPGDAHAGRRGPGRDAGRAEPRLRDPARTRAWSSRDGRLQLLAAARGRGPHRPIDQFFRSLAEDAGHQAIGVVLSGTAHRRHARAARRSRPRAASPSPRTTTAQHDSMPRSAIAAGCVDFVLPPERDRPRARRASAAIPTSRRRRRAERRGRRRRASAEILAAAARRHRRRFHPLQAQHPLPPHHPAHGPAQAGRR